MNANRARAIFVELVAHVPPEQWDGRVAQLAGDDEELRARVAALLAVHRRADSFLEQPAGPILPTAAVATHDIAPEDSASAFVATEKPGLVLAGRYQLLQQLGEGGMGTVWKAQQTEPVKRLVAVKLIRPGMDSQQVLARFEAERQALALMDHPNIARVFDAGTTEFVVPPSGGSSFVVPPLGGSLGAAEDRLKAGLRTGRPFFVMELVQGVPITNYCDEHRLTPRQRLELFVPVCQAIQHAHQKGIIHRDIKPSNVLVTLYDDRPVVKVIDFGVAKATGPQISEETLLTAFGTVVGTVEYMSPEQASLEQVDVDTRSDIYSLGVLLYVLLAGSPPFTRKELSRAGLLEMLRVIREQEPSKPSARLSTEDGLAALAAKRGTEPKRLAALVRGELDWIVMKALEKDRNRRYETANGFAMDVQRYLADEPVLASPPSAVYRLRKFVRRNKTGLSIVAGAFVAMTVMAASIGWAVRDREARRAEIEREKSARQARMEALARDFLNAARTLIAENKLAAAHQKLAEARAQLDQDRTVLGTLAAEVEAYEAELNRLEQFLDLIDRAYEAETTSTVEVTLEADRSGGAAGKAAESRREQRQPHRAIPFLLRALALYDVLQREDWATALEAGLLGRDQRAQIRRTVYEALIWLGDDVLRRRQDQTSFRELSPQAAARQGMLYLARAESSHQRTTAFYALRAQCRTALGENQAAWADRQRADKTPATLALDDYWLGRAAFEARQRAAAIKAFEAALRREPTHYWSLMRLGYARCDYGELREDFAWAVGIFTGCILKRPGHAHAYICRGLAYRKLGREEDRMADCSRAIELNPKLARAWRNRGASYLALGQFERALTDFSRAIEVQPKDAQCWFLRAHAYRNLNQLDKAAADFSRAIGLNPSYTDAWYNRGIVHDKLNQPDKALADFSSAIQLDPNFARAWNKRGIIYLQKSRLDKALADFTAVIQREPGYALPWVNRGYVYFIQGQLDDALVNFDRAIELDPKNAEARYNRGSLYSKLGQADRAVADFRKLAELDLKDAKVWHARIMGDKNLATLRQREDFKHLINGLKQRPPRAAVAKDQQETRPEPDAPLAYYNLGHALERKKLLADALLAFQEAVRLYEPLVAKSPRAPDLYRLGIALDRISVILRDRRQLMQARQALERAIGHLKTATTLAPENTQYRDGLRTVYWSLAETLVRMKDHAEAAKVAAELPNFLPDDGFWYGRAAGYLACCGTLARQDANLPEAKRTTLARTYQDQAKQLLDQAKARMAMNPRTQKAVADEFSYLASRLRRWAGNPRGARPNYDMGIALREGLVEKFPANETYRQDLRRDYGNLAETLLQLADHAEAAREATKLTLDSPAGWHWHRRAAGVLARCASLAAKDDGLAEPLRKKLAQAYADRAMEQLREATRKGFNDGNQLNSDASLKELRRRADFKQLLAELAKNARK
jgi:serine/threonine protein kinase/Tfp pilus assembly protein PilF